MKSLLSLLAVCLTVTAYAQKFEGLVLTPPMGFNTWNTFATNINEVLIMQTADAMVKNGMRGHITRWSGTTLPIGLKNRTRCYC